MTGFYTLPRGWLDIPALDGEREPYCRRAAWVWLVEHARWQDGEANVVGKTVRLLRGQLSFSLRYLANAWRWEESRVRRFLARLVTDKMILSCCDAGQTILTVCNYDAYQVRQDNDDADMPQDHRETAANKKEINNLLIKTPPPIREVQPEVPEVRPVRTPSAPLEVKPSVAVQGSFLPTASILSMDTPATRFEEFLREYPKKVHEKRYRAIAFKAYQVATRTTPHAEIMKGLSGYKFNPDPEFQHHPANWLKQKKWLSEGQSIPKPRTGGQQDTPGDPSADPWGIAEWCAKRAETGMLRAAAEGETSGVWQYKHFVVDFMAKEIAKAARLHIAWRGDWSPMIEWLDAGINLATIKARIKRALEVQQGPTASLRRFDAFILPSRAA